MRPGPADHLQSSILNLASSAVAHAPFQVWTHHWQQVCLTSEPGIELPATLLLPTAAAEGNQCAAILHFDEEGRNRLLNRHGLLARAAGFLEREADHQAILSVDLRGWGDSAPALYPYEMAGWGGVDRYLAYATAALGDPILTMRVRDGLAALTWLRSRAEIDGAQVTVSGCGLGGLVALHVAAADGRVRGVVTWDALVSFRALLETPHYRWPADAFLPNVLQHYDLPELVAALAASACAVAILNPRDGEGLCLPAGELTRLNAGFPAPVYRDGAEDRDMIGALLDCLGRDG